MTKKQITAISVGGAAAGELSTASTDSVTTDLPTKVAQGLTIRTLRVVGLGVAAESLAEKTGLPLWRLYQIERGDGPSEMTPKEIVILRKAFGGIREKSFSFPVSSFKKMGNLKPSKLKELRSRLIKLGGSKFKELEAVLNRYLSETFTESEIRKISSPALIVSMLSKK